MRVVSILLRVALSFVLTLTALDVGLRLCFPQLPRLNDNFSGAYLRRIIAGKDIRRSVVVLGDSALWGYKISAADTAATRLAREGVPIVNLSFEGGSIVNTYAMLRYMEAHDALPSSIIFNVNLKEFNAADSAYQTLYPGLEQIAWTYLTPSERRLLISTQAKTLDARIDRALSRVWFLYGARNDIRELLFHQSDAASFVNARVNALSGEAARASNEHQVTADRFLGTYDLSPLADTNVEVIFLKKTVALLQRHKLLAIGILTPTNHQLLHEYIDVADYHRQLVQVNKYMETGGVRVLDYDSSFSGRYFIDNDHLTALGNQRLAANLRRDLHL